MLRSRNPFNRLHPATRLASNALTHTLRLQIHLERKAEIPKRPPPLHMGSYGAAHSVRQCRLPLGIQGRRTKREQGEGASFTGFTSTKVQILTQKSTQGWEWRVVDYNVSNDCSSWHNSFLDYEGSAPAASVFDAPGAQFTCFTSTPDKY